MTYYDVAMVSVVIAGMVWGAMRGITWQVASIASLVLGYGSSHALSGQVAPMLPGDPVVARALAMLITYVGVSGGVFFAAWLVRATLRKMQFEAYDRHLGMLLGGMEGALLGMVATMFVVSLAPQTRGPIFSSPTGKVVGQVMDSLGPVLPGEVRTVLAPFWNGEGTGSGTLAGDSAAPAADPQSAAADPQGASTGTGTAANGPSVADVESKLSDFLDKQEKKVGRVIVDTARKELQDQTGTTSSDDRAVERR